MSRQETLDTICVLLEEYSGGEVEDVAEGILGVLAATGDDLLDALDPPPGLQRWLVSHGLSLVATHEVAAPRVWEALEEEDQGGGSDLEERTGGEPLLQVGSHIAYRTAPSGPHNQSTIGSGWIVAFRSTIDGATVVIAESAPGQEVWLDPQTDLIQLEPRPLAPEQNAEDHPS